MLSKSNRVIDDTRLDDGASPGVLQALPTVSQGPSGIAEITYLNGLNPDGSISANSYWGYHNTTAFKFGASTAGTGATISFAFNTFSNFTTAEQDTFRAAFAEWASVANLTFVETSNLGTADILLARGSDGGAYTESSNTDGLGGTLGHPTGQTLISIDSSVYGFELDGSFTASGGYGWGTIMHEIGHALGLGHAGPYDGDVDPSTQQYSAFDDVLWTAMSYINWRDTNAKYRAAYPVPGANWGQFQGPGFTDSRDSPHTIMALDILAIQQLYGAPVNSIMSGGQVYGFNTNITGPIRTLFDFTVNKTPIITLFNTGTGNTLDTSGFTVGQTISLVPGTFSNLAGLSRNLYIAEGTRIDTAIGGTKDDVITANDFGDTLYGMDGNDTLTGGAGNDFLYGGTSVDSFDKIKGGGGNDHIEGRGDLDGGDGDDYIDGNGPIQGGAGNDQIIARGDSFLIHGGDGDDVITTLTSDTGHLFGDGGNDTIRISMPTQPSGTGGEIDGGDGIDTIYAASGFTVDLTARMVTSGVVRYFTSNVENIAVTLAGVAATATGDANANVIAVIAASDTGGVAATLDGRGGNDILIGGKGDDVLDGGTGIDSLTGGAGNDTYKVDAQGDLVFENANGGTDSVISTANFYLYANVENLTLAAGAGNIFGVGNELANAIDGNEGNNTLLAGAGIDVVHGGAGVDIIYGEDGNDQLFGDADNDFLAGGQGDDVMDGGTGGDSLYGEDGNDTLTGGTDFVFDQLVGGNGNDILHGDSGLADYDYLYGNAGDDSFYVDTGDDLTFEQAGEGIDTVYATVPGANNGVYLYANIENLVLLGTTSFGVGNVLANVMTGNASGNYLLGGDGNDRLNGKAGNDVLFGQAGADTFVFEHGTGGDVVGDFVPGTDKIDLTAIGYTYAQILNAIHENGGNTAIDLGGGDLVVLNGVTAAQLSASDFVLAGGGAAVEPTAYQPDEVGAPAFAAFLPIPHGDVSAF